MGVKRIVKFSFGLLTFFIGCAIVVWVVYLFFFPNEFRIEVTQLPGLLMPAVFIWFGWSWMRGEPAEKAAPEYELVITLKLSGEDFGTAAERQRVLDMKHRLEEKLAEYDLAKIDGEEFGGGECSVFVQTNAPNKAAEMIRGFLAAEGLSDYTLNRSYSP